MRILLSQNLTSLLLVAVMQFPGGCQDTRLIDAVKSKDTTRTKRLVDQKLDLNVVDSSGLTALHHAILVGNKDSYMDLLNAGADPNLCDKSGKSVVHLAAQQPEIYWLHEALQHNGNPNLENLGSIHFPNSTPIFFALYKGQADAAMELIEHGANVNHLNGNGVSPLPIAMGSGLYKVVIALLRAGADPRRGEFTIFDNGWFLNGHEKMIGNEQARQDYEELKQFLIDRGELPKPQDQPSGLPK